MAMSNNSKQIAGAVVVIVVIVAIIALALHSAKNSKYVVTSVPISPGSQQAEANNLSSFLNVSPQQDYNFSSLNDQNLPTLPK